MKRIFTILLSITLLFSTSAVFANDNHEVTFEELMEITDKYNIEPVIVNDSLNGKEVLENLTKEELESIIVKGLEEISKPLYFEEEVSVADILPLPTELNTPTDLITTLSTWKVARRTATLTRSGTFAGIQQLRLRQSVAASYQFEYQSIPGEPDPTRNWRFTSCSNGDVIHLNSGEYILKKVSSTAKVSSSDTIVQNYSGVYNAGFYLGVSGVKVRVPLGDNDFKGMISYRISEVK